MGYLTGAGSDYAAFMHYLGISSMDIAYTYDRVRPRSLDLIDLIKFLLDCMERNVFLCLCFQSKTRARIYPAYHTAYDTFEYVSKFIDPGELTTI